MMVVVYLSSSSNSEENSSFITFAEEAGSSSGTVQNRALSLVSFFVLCTCHAYKDAIGVGIVL